MISLQIGLQADIQFSNGTSRTVNIPVDWVNDSLDVGGGEA
jgi:hypothetical protein